MKQQSKINSLFFGFLLVLLAASVKSGGLSPFFAMAFTLLLGAGFFFSHKKGSYNE